MNKGSIADLLAKIPGSGILYIDEPMSKHTSFKIGGSADIFVKPLNAQGLINILQLCTDNGIPIFVMGNGTNLIVRDKGIRGIVVKITDNISGHDIKGEEIIAESGILLSHLAVIAMENGLTGLEFAEGIPGTLGGAVAMNAGAYDGEMSGIVMESEYLSPGGIKYKLSSMQHCFGKRSSFIQADGGIVLNTRLCLKRGNKEQIQGKMQNFRTKRREKQPLDMPSAGSIFRRPEGYFAGKLIQDCGLRGCRIGGAEVSGLHCGFIVNTGNASAEDVITLIKHIQRKVNEIFGIPLLTEVKIVGEE